MILLQYNLFAQEIRQYQADIQGNTYQIFDQEIVKLNAATAEEFRYSNKLLGNISMVDVTNPLRPLIFYADVQKMVITDNTLSKQNQQVISFEGLDMFQIQCIASSKINNGIWVYDQELLQIVKLDRTLNREIETGNLLQILNLNELAPSKMIEKSGYLYVYCPYNGVLIFDMYGTFYRKIPLKDILVWNVLEDKIVYTTLKGIWVYHLKDFKSEQLEKKMLSPDKVLWIDELFIYYLNEKKEVKRIDFK